MGTIQAQTNPLKEKGYAGSSLPVKQDPPPAQNPFTTRPQVTSVGRPYLFLWCINPYQLHLLTLWKFDLEKFQSAHQDPVN